MITLLSSSTTEKILFRISAKPKKSANCALWTEEGKQKSKQRKVKNQDKAVNNLKVEIKFKMALRKQPDRQVKKRRKIEIPENLDVSKKKRKLEESGNFDIIGNLFCNYGLTGKNLVHDIFSYMDVSSIQGGHLVCKTWNLFLINDRKLLMRILRRTQPYFEFLSKQLSDEDFDAADERKMWRDFFDLMQNYSCHKIIQIFKRIQMIHTVLQDLVQDCPVFEVFRRDFVGEKLAGEIRSQIDQAEMEKLLRPKLRFESNFDWLFEQITKVKACHDHQRSLKDYWNAPRLIPWSQEANNLFQVCLVSSKRALKTRENQLYQVIKITLLDLVIVDV